MPGWLFSFLPVMLMDPFSQKNQANKDSSHREREDLATKHKSDSRVFLALQPFLERSSDDVIGVEEGAGNKGREGNKTRRVVSCVGGDGGFNNGGVGS